MTWPPPLNHGGEFSSMVRSQPRTRKARKSPFGLSMSATRKRSRSGRFTDAIPLTQRKLLPAAWPKIATLNSFTRRCPHNLRHLMEITAQETSEPFGPVIYAYSRSQAVADGQQVE